MGHRFNTLVLWKNRSGSGQGSGPGSKSWKVIYHDGTDSFKTIGNFNIHKIKEQTIRICTSSNGDHGNSVNKKINETNLKIKLDGIT